jgi:hypothetical protein
MVTAGTEALVVLGNKFLYACVKEVCCLELGHFLTPSVDLGWSSNPQLQCSSSARMQAAVCRLAFLKRGTTLDISIPCLLFRFWRYCGLSLHEFHHQHYFPVLDNGFHQFSHRVYVNLLRGCVFISVLTAFWFRHPQMRSRFHRLLWCDIEIHCHLQGVTLKKSKPKEAVLCILWGPVNIFGSHLA